MTEKNVPLSTPQNDPALPLNDPLKNQLVNMNFVIKSTQSEVIKLQKVLIRYQNRQDELEKKVNQLEEHMERLVHNQQADVTFRARFWPRMLGAVMLSVLLALWLHQLGV